MSNLAYFVTGLLVGGAWGYWDGYRICARAVSRSLQKLVDENRP